jgi:hypothetical protein
VGGCPRLVVNRAKIMQLAEEGLTVREIAQEAGISPASTHRILRSHRMSSRLELP